MNGKQQSKLKMYLTVRIFLLANPEITAKLPNFPEFMAALDAAILQIQNNSQEQSIDTTGVAESKQEYRELLIQATIDASGKIQAYAKYIRDSVLLAETKFTKTDLRHLSALDLVDAASGLKGRIDANLSNLALYGLTAESQIKFGATIEDYRIAIPLPRQSQLWSREKSLLETQGFEMGDEAIDNIDSVVEIVRLTEPIFYTGYKNARRIIPQGITSIQVQGNVTEAANGKPIPYALLTFRLTGQTEAVMAKETAAKGRFQIKSLSEGVYDISVSKVGFITQVVTLTVRWDELCNVDIALEKI